jgi:hypothetical protein
MSIYRKHLRSSCMRAIRSAVISAGLVACVASALANEPPGGPSVVITPNCVACLRFEDLAINRGIDLRPAMVSDLTDSPGSIFNVGRAVTSRSIGRAYGNEPREAVIGERVGYKSLGLGEGLTGADSRYVAAEDAAWGAIVWGNPGQWVLEAKGLRAAAGKRLADAFVQRGFCDPAPNALGLPLQRRNWVGCDSHRPAGPAQRGQGGLDLPRQTHTDS